MPMSAAAKLAAYRKIIIFIFFCYLSRRYLDDSNRIDAFNLKKKYSIVFNFISKLRFYPYPHLYLRLSVAAHLSESNVLRTGARTSKHASRLSKTSP